MYNEFLKNRKSIVEQYRQPEDKLFIAKVLDQAFLCIKENLPHFSGFVDPMKCDLAQKALANFPSVNCCSYGGSRDCERVMLGIFPENPSLDLFPIRTLGIQSSKFAKPFRHRDILGSMMGLGIERDMIGDIILEGQKAYVFTHAQVYEHIFYQLERIGKEKVTLFEMESADFEPKISKTNTTIIVPSLRTDAVVSAIFKLSRNKAATLIKNEKLFINWHLVVSVSQPVKNGDIITLRGYGRALFKRIIKQTKKDRFVAEIEIMK